MPVTHYDGVCIFIVGDVNIDFARSIFDYALLNAKISGYTIYPAPEELAEPYFQYDMNHDYLINDDDARKFESVFGGFSSAFLETDPPTPFFEDEFRIYFLRG